ncbi:hypothetical protein ACEUDE_18810 [Aeromonas veronii]
MATQATEKEYERLAKNHYEILKEKGLNITAKNIADELLARASKCSPGYWRKLRCALVYHLRIPAKLNSHSGQREHPDP